MKKIISILVLFISLFLITGCTEGINDLSINDDDVFIYLTSLNRISNNYEITITDETSFRSSLYFKTSPEDEVPYSMMIIGYAYVKIKYNDYEGPANNEMIPIFGWSISLQQYIRMRDITLVKIEYTSEQIIYER